MTLAERVLQGDRLALARLLSHIENDTEEGKNGLKALFARTGKAHIVGVTGPPGTGKSSLVNQLALHFRKAQNPPQRVGIVAVDPSSPFSGGAILGDRVRMRDLAGDPGVFIRSMASRGSLGGLAAATAGVVQALDAAGYEVIFVETVGAGQAEVDIARLAHTTLVVEAPGLGDEIQAIKAGILEIADILVVNKADRPEAEATERALKSMLQLGHPLVHRFENTVEKPGHESAEEAARPSTDDLSAWIPPVVRTVATTGEGVEMLCSHIRQHWRFLLDSGEWQARERQRLRSELDLLLREALLARWRQRVPQDDYWAAVEAVMRREVSPWEVVERLVQGC